MDGQKPIVIVPAIETAPYLDVLDNLIPFYLSETEARTLRNLLGVYFRKDGRYGLKIANHVEWSTEEIRRGEDVAKIVFDYGYATGLLSRRDRLNSGKLEFLCYKKENPYVRTSIGIKFGSSIRLTSLLEGTLDETELFYSPWYDTLNGPNHSGCVAIPRLSLPEQFHEGLINVALQICKNSRFKPNPEYKSLPFLVRRRLKKEFRNGIKDLEAAVSALRH